MSPLKTQMSIFRKCVLFKFDFVWLLTVFEVCLCYKMAIMDVFCEKCAIWATFFDLVGNISPHGQNYLRFELFSIRTFSCGSKIHLMLNIVLLWVLIINHFKNNFLFLQWDRRDFFKFEKNNSETYKTGFC